MQTDDTNLSNVTFSMNVDTNAGTLTIPQYGGAITLAGRESKIIVTNYAFGQSVLQYSTAEVMTWTTIDDIDVIVLYALAGQQTETVVQSTATNVTLTQSSSAISSNVVNGTVVLSGSPNGISVAQFGRVKVIVMDKATAGTLWNPRLTASTYDLSPRQSSVLIGGPYLVRNATISGSTISIFGDIKATGTLSVVAPASVNTVLFNGATVSGTTDAAGVFSGSVSDSIGTVTVPTLTTAAWSCADTLPEVATSFDDSTWVVANKTETHRPFQPTAGKVCIRLAVVVMQNQNDLIC
ncbi:hypothetical protein BD410DRAFT_578005 [Rickenella mellea]|uniref:Beta-galactosidase domain-containing protein n=1 Tax=Rickenella mellea TaxID=50990 RepID=A0A4Y7QGD4_9AGAM|nr:hypothetical protein BD410DRAFT_578005 [Rickenella mellea]